jgi:formylglycine-generating enzyme required for sulfatase activity
MADPATVSGYRLDKYDVTVGRFRQFVAAWNGGSGWTPPAGSGKHTHLGGGQGLVDSVTAAYETGWVTSDNSDIVPTNAELINCGGSNAYATSTNNAGSQESLPINCVNWYEAYAFCIWDGGFLPSLAEWGYAAAGGSQQRFYPWGSTTPGSACPGTGCNQYAIWGCYYPSGTGNCSNVSNIAPVGTATLGAALWGQLDLVGELNQWVLDWDSIADPCTDCAYLTGGAATGSTRVARGDAFNGPSSSLASSDCCNHFSPTARPNDTGFRCARPP